MKDIFGCLKFDGIWTQYIADKTSILCHQNILFMNI